MFFNKVHDDQAVSTEDTNVKTSKRVRFAKNTNDETTHQSTADKAEEISDSEKVSGAAAADSLSAAAGKKGNERKLIIHHHDRFSENFYRGGAGIH